MKLNKNLKKILVVSLLIINILMITNISSASFSIDKGDLYSKGYAESLLKYRGVTVKTSVIVYKKDGIEYPAYCVQKGIAGVGESGNYTVTVDGAISNSALYRVILNGYPYKTLEQLGCKTVGEAFTATKQAVYFTLDNRNLSQLNDYEPIGEAGKRTFNALKTILTNAQNSNQTKPSSYFKIVSDNNWKEEKNKLSKTFVVSAEADFSDYKVEIKNAKIETEIVDLNNNRKTTFKKGEKFKVLIPLLNKGQDGSFDISINGKLNTKPILYGKSPNTSLQDYALTGSFYELRKRRSKC